MMKRLRLALLMFICFVLVFTGCTGKDLASGAGVASGSGIASGAGSSAGAGVASGAEAAEQDSGYTGGEEDGDEATAPAAQSSDYHEEAENSDLGAATETLQTIDVPAYPDGEEGGDEETDPEPAQIDRDGEYTSKEDVALYLHIYGVLPRNFITKSEAKKLGWPGGGLDDYVYGGCIGGDKFSNFEGSLPRIKGITYKECDIDTMHKNKRGVKRLIYSSGGSIYYTPDHYNTYELLYSGEELY
jgi:hypothetical protein